MCNDYSYIDPDHVYTDTSTGVLKNIPGITEQSALEFFESAAVTKRIKELKNRPVKIKDSTTLLFIHKYLFQDVYSWAGQKRVVEIGKDGKQFFPTVGYSVNLFVSSRLKRAMN